MKTSFFWTLILAFALPTVLFSCDDDDDAQPDPQTIVDVAASDPQFSTLVSALQRTGLDDVVAALPAATVFAPTNDAFNALGVDLNAISDTELSEILLYHVITAEVPSTAIEEGQTYVTTAATTGPGDSQLSLLVEKAGTSVTVNGVSAVISADVDASNGVIHVVNTVLMPLDIVGHATANDNFTELVGALGAASEDLVSVLQGTGPFTVFAPVNTAFEEVASVVAGLTAEQITDVLTYHVVAGNVRSSTLTNGMEVTTVNGGMFTVNLGSTVTITDTQGNTATVILTDVQATNGVIHVLDKVILPQL